MISGAQGSKNTSAPLLLPWLRLSVPWAANMMVTSLPSWCDGPLALGYDPQMNVEPQHATMFLDNYIRRVKLGYTRWCLASSWTEGWKSGWYFFSVAYLHLSLWQFLCLHLRPAGGTLDNMERKGHFGCVNKPHVPKLYLLYPSFGNVSKFKHHYWDHRWTCNDMFSINIIELLGSGYLIFDHPGDKAAICWTLILWFLGHRENFRNYRKI